MKNGSNTAEEEDDKVDGEDEEEGGEDLQVLRTITELAEMKTMHPYISLVHINVYIY